MIRTLFRGVVVLLYLGWIIVAVMMSLDTGGGEALKNGVSAAVIGLLALGLGWLALIILSWLLLMLSHITSYKYWLGAVVGGILLLAHLPLPQVVAGGVGTGVAAFILSPVFKYMGGLIEYLLNTTTAAPIYRGLAHDLAQGWVIGGEESTGQAVKALCLIGSGALR